MSKQSPSSESKRIANGHAWSKHRGEFPELATVDEFAQPVDEIIRRPTASKKLHGGREAFWGATARTVVIKSPSDPDGGTAFRPVMSKAYFDNSK